jgi:hypothetical protein
MPGKAARATAPSEEKVRAERADHPAYEHALRPEAFRELYARVTFRMDMQRTPEVWGRQLARSIRQTSRKPRCEIVTFRAGAPGYTRSRAPRLSTGAPSRNLPFPRVTPRVATPLNLYETD